MSRPVVSIGGVFALAAALAQGAGAEVAEVGGQVRFSLRPEGGSRTVHVAGDWNGWTPSGAWALTDPDGDGTYEGTFDLPPGRHLFKYVVDGDRWVPDPDVAETEEDGHGGKNSVLTVGEGAGAGDASPGGTTTERSPFGSTTRTRQPAFTGEVFFVEPGTQRIPDLSKLTPQGQIFCETFDVAPRKFSDGFPGLSERFEWFVIRYRGQFRVDHGGTHRFRLLSDDGSKLLINGRLAVDNDGLHEPREVVQLVKLPAGTYDLTLEYMQGPALDVALQLWVTRPGSTSEELVRVAAPTPAR
jgi:hypothetical protein